MPCAIRQPVSTPGSFSYFRHLRYISIYVVLLDNGYLKWDISQDGFDIGLMEKFKSHSSADLLWLPQNVFAQNYFFFIFDKGED